MKERSLGDILNETFVIYGKGLRGFLLIAFPGFQAKSVSDVGHKLQLYLLRAQMLPESFVSVFGD